jgi:putative DNA primase/helicase
MKPKRQLTDDIRAAIASVGIPAITAALAAERMPFERLPGDTRPERPGKVTDLLQDAQATLAAIRKGNDPPRLFRRAGLAWLENDDEGRPGAVHLDAARLTHYLAETMLFVVDRQVGDAVTTVPVPPPSVLVRDLLATPDPPVPVLARIVTSPVVTRTGVIHERSGYDAGSQAYYAPPPGFVVPPVPAQPTAEQITAARDALLEIFTDFPFLAAADRANTLAAVLTPFARDLIAGPTPMALVTKPAPGTGASLLTSAIAQLVTGAPAAVMAEAKDDEEWRKRITTVLRPAPSVALFDNLTGTLHSSALAAALTSTSWQDRALGTNEEIRVPIRCLWLATGNNVILASDFMRRVVPIRLDAGVERPWLRNRDGGLVFRHPELLGWVGRERARLVHAALVLVRAWVAAERPLGPVVMGSYEDWNQIIGGILAVAQVPGFLANLDDLYEGSDLDGDEARRFLSAWWEQFADTPQSPADLFALATSDAVMLTLSGEKEHARRTSFGKFVERHRDRPYAIKDGLNVKITKPRTGGRPLWKLVTSTPPRRGGSGASGGCFTTTHPHIENLIDRKNGGGHTGAETPSQPSPSPEGQGSGVQRSPSRTADGDGRCSGCHVVDVRARLTDLEGELWCPSCLHAKSSYRSRRKNDQ